MLTCRYGFNANAAREVLIPCIREEFGFLTSVVETTSLYNTLTIVHAEREVLDM